jgi:GNAT superfamily N-acetyltransferase
MAAIRSLTSMELRKYQDHLLRLDAEDRRLRFGHRVSDQKIEAFVAGLHGSRHRVLAHFDDALNVIGAALVSHGDEASVELAFSVERSYRGRGLGRDLLERAVLHARNRAVRRADVHMLAENRAMSHLARSVGTHLEAAAGEYEGFFEVPPLTPLSLVREVLAEQAGFNDFAKKAGRRLLAGTMVLQPAI